MEHLARPRRIFIDTGHLINLVDAGLGRALRGKQNRARVDAYTRMLELLRGGAFVPLVYEPSTYEWVYKNSLQRALQIAAVFDSAICAKRVILDPVLFVVEAMQEFQRMEPTIPFPAVRIVDDLGLDAELHTWFRRAWPKEDELPEPIVVAVQRPQLRPTVREFVEQVHREVNRAPRMWEVALEGERVALEGTRETLRKLNGRKRVPDFVRRHWLRSAHFLDQVLRRTAPEVDVDRLLSTINLDACPAIQLKLDAYWSYAKANSAPKAGDMIDLMMFAVLPYADFALIERRMHEYVHQARPAEAASRWFWDPVDLVAAAAA